MTSSLRLARAPWRRPARPSVAVLAWSANGDRAGELARALGGEARCYYDLKIVDRRLVPVRYLLSAVRTLGYVVRRRPRAVVATNPPIVPGLIAWAYGRAAGAHVVLDSHPSAFDPHVHAQLARQLPVHRWLTPRVAATIVAGADLEGVVRSWGGTPIVLHEAEPAWRVAPAGPPAQRPRILAIGIFSYDEPVAEVLDAARMLSDCDIALTGDLRRCPSDLRRHPPPNVRFTGYLRGEAYRAALEQADVILSLTTRSEGACRAAHEAVEARRPLVASDWPTMRELFPHAVHVDNDAAAIAGGVRAALARHAELTAGAGEARAVQRARVAAQLARLRAALELPSARTDRTPGSAPPALVRSAA
jgi:glycosyltransferase involved in cell wall biosynthesis